jgi:hypothetical protein
MTEQRQGKCCVCETEATVVDGTNYGVGAPAQEHNNPATGKPCEGVRMSTN